MIDDLDDDISFEVSIGSAIVFTTIPTEKSKIFTFYPPSNIFVGEYRIKVILSDT